MNFLFFYRFFFLLFCVISVLNYVVLFVFTFPFVNKLLDNMTIDQSIDRSIDRTMRWWELTSFLLKKKKNRKICKKNWLQNFYLKNFHIKVLYLKRKTQKHWNWGKKFIFKTLSSDNNFWEKENIQSLNWDLFSIFYIKIKKNSFIIFYKKM